MHSTNPVSSQAFNSFVLTVAQHLHVKFIDSHCRVLHLQHSSYDKA